jgi:antitoxin (DNA-binding transcriptional repressor) of toxin-antitoxin stability system
VEHRRRRGHTLARLNESGDFRAPAWPVVDVVDMPDYHVVMTSVGTADLKAHLSKHLQAVRRGETIVVLDRREPIARIVPIGAAGLELVVRPALGALQDVPLLGPSRSDIDVLEQLREERAERL